MLSGNLYDSSDSQLVEERRQARLLLQALNSSSENAQEDRERIIRRLLPRAGRKLRIQPPFFCDYGTNIITGDDVYCNYNCVLLDVMLIRIGNRTLLGPNVQIYAATHPMDCSVRAAGLEFARPVEIGDDGWIGGGAIICPGVTVGDRCVIGAGSVVTRDIPPDVFAAGNPCRIIRALDTDQQAK